MLRDRCCSFSRGVWALLLGGLAHAVLGILVVYFAGGLLFRFGFDVCVVSLICLLCAVAIAWFVVMWNVLVCLLFGLFECYCGFCWDYMCCLL